MKIILSILIICLFFSGCGLVNMWTLKSKTNRFNELSLGMEKSNVIAIMGKPFKTEIKQSKEGASYEIIYYYLTSANQDGITAFTLTPIILEDNIVKGLGLDEYNNLVKK